MKSGFTQKCICLLGFLFLRSPQREEVRACESRRSACNSGERATKADPTVHCHTRYAGATQRSYFSDAVAFCSYFPAACGHCHEAMLLRRVEGAKPSSLALGTGWQEPTRDTLPFVTCKGQHQALRNHASPSQTGHQKQMETFDLHCYVPHFLISTVGLMCSLASAEPVRDGERAGQQRRGGSTSHRAESTAASEAFLYKVCGYLLSDKD